MSPYGAVPGAIVLGKPVFVSGNCVSASRSLLLIDPALPKSYCVVSLAVLGACRAVIVS